MPTKLNPFTCKPDLVSIGNGTATVQFDIDANTAPGTDPALPTGAGAITIGGAAVSAHSIPVETHARAANAFNIEVQVGSSVTGAPGNTNAAGLVQFNDTHFSVDSDGYVSLIGGGIGLDSFSTDISGPVTPDGAGNVDVTGTSIYSDGSVANTLTLNVQATANTLLYGAGSNTTVSELGPLTNGQLVIGSTGLSPVAASLASADGSITITPGAGSIDLAVAAGNDAILTLTGDTGGAISPTSGNINIVGGTGIGTSGSSSNMTINLDSPVTVSNGGTGATTLTDGGVLIGSGTSAVTVTAQPTNGQLLIGSTGSDPVLATLTEGSGITITEGAGSITVASSGGGLAWVEVTGTTQSAAVNTGYITNNASLVTVTLPSTAALGEVIRVTGEGAGGWSLAQNAGQTVHFGNQSTTTGAGGSLASSHRRDTVELVCVTANTDFNVLSSIGNITIT
jgi:hypothetical protein